MSQSRHQPVLVETTVELLRVRPRGVYLDATVGGGGWAAAVLEAGAAQVVGFDWDEEALSRVGERLARFGERLRLIRTGFQEMSRVLAEMGLRRIDGVAADLGLSSDQLAQPERGFSFQLDGPLDMRMDRRLERTAAELVAHSSREELKRILSCFGQERRAGRIAAAVVRERARRPIKTTAHLAEVVASAAGARKGPGRPKLHPATKTFMALRVAINEELENLKRFLDQLPGVLKPGGRGVVVAYHSLEDRLVKESFTREAKGCVCPPHRPCVCGRSPVFMVLTRKPIRPGEDEVARNPRARSARLRAVERT